VSKGGNYLLNIGPSPEGEFDDIAYSRLKEIGAWMKINGEAIYNTRMYTVFGEGDRIRYTKSKDGKTTYIFLLDFPKDPISLTKIRFSKNTSIRMLGSNSTLSWKQNDQAVNITVPPSAQSSCDHAWVIKVTN
ncbi:MAG: alpha-L-fucosidase C-terminal domain-containing protein, partial [Saprospiraceae bacterium]